MYMDKTKFEKKIKQYAKNNDRIGYSEFGMKNLAFIMLNKEFCLEVIHKHFPIVLESKTEAKR